MYKFVVRLSPTLLWIVSVRAFILGKEGSFAPRKVCLCSRANYLYLICRNIGPENSPVVERKSLGRVDLTQEVIKEQGKGSNGESNLFDEQIDSLKTSCSSIYRGLYLQVKILLRK